MKRLVVLLLAVLVLFVVLRAGWVLPHRYIGDGVNDYSGVEKDYAAFAIEEAKMQANELGSPGLLVTAYRVTDVRRCPGRPIRCGPAIRVRKGVYRENPACEGNPFTVDVQTYTFFGLPLGSADLPCDQ